MSLRTTAATRFDTFDMYRTSYKNIGTHEIEVNVLVPREITPGKKPVVVKWHGGGLSTGTAAYPDWFSGFWVPFLHRNSAITILPNYRLVPEHTGNDILADISDFWVWFCDTLPSYLSSQNPSISIDFSKVLVSGESAGGWCSLQSVMTLPEGTIKACLVQYPLTNRFPVSPDALVMGYPIPPKEKIDEILAARTPETVLSSVTPPERMFVTMMLQAYGYWDEAFGTGKHLMPDTRLEVEGTKYSVPTYIIHGEDDTIVNVKWSRDFVEKAKALFPGTKVTLATQAGDHGFDNDMYEEDAEWLKAILAAAEGDWLG